jgi:exonuclease III
MQLATWNVNSLKVRLPQVLAWLAANPVDALCLQELKLDHDKFPLQAFQEIGYHASWAGQKTYNGVAVISREPGPARDQKYSRLRRSSAARDCNHTTLWTRHHSSH